MIRGLFERLCRDSNHGKTLVSHSLGYLAAARNGLSEDELLDLLSQSYTVFKDFLRRAHHRPPARRLPVVVWSRLYFELEPYLTERRADNALLLTFYHRQLKTAATEMYLTSQSRQQLHRGLARYFKSKPLQVEHQGQKLIDRRKLSELPHNQAYGRMWDEIPATLCDLEFLHAKACEGLVYDAIEDYNVALSLMDDPGSFDTPRPEIKELISEFSISFNQESYTFQRRPKVAAQQLFNSLFVQAGNDGAAGVKLREFATRAAYPSGAWLRRRNVAPATSTSRALLRTIQAHDGAVTAVAVSPSGTRLASGGANGLVHVWGQRDGALLAVMPGHEDGVTGLAWIPGESEEALLCSCGRDQQIKVWDWRLERLVRQWPAHSDNTRALVALSTVARERPAADIATCSDDRTIRGWDSRTGAEQFLLRGHTDRVLCLAPGEDDEIFSGGEDRTVRRWPLDQSREAQTLRGSMDIVRSVAAGTDSSWIASGGDDRTLRIWNVQSGSSRACAGHRQRINCVGVLTNIDPGSDRGTGSLIASGSDDETLRIWSAGSGEELHTLHGHAGALNTIGVDPCGRWVCSGGDDGTLRVWRAAHGSATAGKSVEHQARINSLAQGADGGTLISGSDDHTIKIWNRAGGDLITTLRGHSGPVTSLAVFQEFIVSGSADHTLRVWNAGNGNHLRTLGSLVDTASLPGLFRGSARQSKGHQNPVTCLARVSSNTIASGSKDSTVKLWDIESGDELRELTGARGVIETLLVSADRRLLIATGSAPQIFVWNLDSSEPARLLGGHSSRVSCATLAREHSLVTGSLDKTVRLWNLESREAPKCFNGHTDWVTCVASDAEARIIASGGRDAKVMIWDSSSGAFVTLGGHTNCVRGVAIDAANRRVVSYADDQWLILWNLDDGREIAAVHVDGPISSLLMLSSNDYCLGTRRGGLAFLTLENAAAVRPVSPGFTQRTAM
jgi:WD40 repeat protein